VLVVNAKVVIVLGNEDYLHAIQVGWHFTNFQDAHKGFKEDRCHELSCVLEKFHWQFVSSGGLPQPGATKLWPIVSPQVNSFMTSYFVSSLILKGCSPNIFP
jgi:hypothetical protein